MQAIAEAALASPIKSMGLRDFDLSPPPPDGSLWGSFLHVSAIIF